MVSAWRDRAVIGILCLGACGCERVASSLSALAPQNAQTGAQTPESTTARSRYQLEKDRQGRLIRLDTQTGAITVVESNSRTAPASRSTRGDERADSTASTRTADQPTPSPAAATLSEQISIPQPQAATAAPSPTDACLRLDTFREAVTMANVPVYIQPRELQTPLTTLPSALMVAVSERTDDWYLVRFDDRRWGPRVGYVHCSGVRALSPADDNGPAR